MYRVFEPSSEFANQDRAPFKFRHRLEDHPSLSLDHLSKLIPQLPKPHVYYSGRPMKQGEDFDKAVSNERDKVTIEEVIENLRTSSSYIMIREPEIHASFKEVHREVLADVTQSIRDQGLGNEALEPMLFVFISSPNSITPFHYDRKSNFLLQIRGYKEVTVFPPWDDRVITSDEYEGFMARNGGVTWKPAAEPLGQTFGMVKGDTLHIPFVAGHHVKNGPDDLSISLSVFFNNQRTKRQLNAMLFNHRLRPVLGKAGVRLTPAGGSAAVDSLKSLAFRAAHRLRRGIESRID